ncbi:hypothetical protein Droror1_Dr00004240 [Drosera rotundifolia]
MAGGVVVAAQKGDFQAKLTAQVILCSIIAAFGGLMFGYDIGISGGVTSMDDFLKKFFPDVYVKKHEVKENNYCKYDSQKLQLFTSSLYLTAIVFSFVSSVVCKKYGRKLSMQIASVFFVAGAILSSLAGTVSMVITGRVLLGAGIGMANQVVPLFISEISPPKFRGGLNIMFQLLITIGILIANLVNYKTSKVKKIGWRISLGGAIIPGLALLLGSLLILETPTSLIERNKKEEGLRNLKKIRGSDEVEIEYEQLLQAAEEANKVTHPFSKLVKRKCRPQLVCGTIIHMFQQLSGINMIMFYAPVLFQTMGYKSDASLLSAVVMGSVNVVTTLVAVFSVDRVGRKFLLLEAAVQMFICQIAMGGIFLVHLHAQGSVSAPLAKLIVSLVCIFVGGFAWSWGPLCWLISSEIYPLEIRPAGLFLACSTNMLFTFVIAQGFLTMLCHMRSGAFFFFGAIIVIAGTFIFFFMPETKGVPIDEMEERLWKLHWYWRKYFDEDDDDHVAKKVELEFTRKGVEGENL